MGNKVGIIILPYDNNKHLNKTLMSLERAKCRSDFEIGFIGDGTEPETVCVGHSFIDTNITKLTQRFMDDPLMSQLCLLCSGVIVSDYWLDYLLDSDFDVVGPVTNAVGNEQAISIDYKQKSFDSEFDAINEFAGYRYDTYGNASFVSESLFFFCTLFKKSVVEKIGVFNNHLLPGSAENMEYCSSMNNTGIVQYVLRGCFVHCHDTGFSSEFSASMSTPKSADDVSSEQNRYDRPDSNHWKILLSCKQDMITLESRKVDVRSIRLINRTLQKAEILVREWVDCITWLQSEQYIDERIKERNTIEAKRAKTIFFAIEKLKEMPSELQDYTTVDELNVRRLMLVMGKKIEARFIQVFNQEKYNDMLDTSYQMRGLEKPLVPLRLISGRQVLKKMASLFMKKIDLRRRKDISEQIQPNDAETQEVIAQPAQSNEEIEKALINRLHSADNKVVVHAPMFNEENERDGYIQRIKRVDETIFTDYLRVYVLESGEMEQLSIEEIDDYHFFIRYDSHKREQRDLIFRIAEICGLMYVHSINRFMPYGVDTEMLQLLNRRNVKTIWDVHGAVPEECLMYGNEEGYRIANEIEKYFFHYADVIIVVNEATKKHLIDKYKETNARFIIMPIFNINIDIDVSDIVIIPQQNEKPTIVYAGGVQKWQNITLMRDIMEGDDGFCYYRIYVQDKDAMNSYWHRGIPGNVIVDSKAPEDLPAAYAECDYGMVLRDDTVVNRVACPTKILEYVLNGVVPVFKTPDIGDFVALGMQYVDYKALMNRQLPSDTERMRMARNNLEVLNRLFDCYRNGVQTLKVKLKQYEIEVNDMTSNMWRHV